MRLLAVQSHLAAVWADLLAACVPAALVLLALEVEVLLHVDRAPRTPHLLT